MRGAVRLPRRPRARARAKAGVIHARSPGHLLIVAGEVLAFGIVPLLVTGLQLAALIRGHALAVDFRGGPWIAGRWLLAGHSPYVDPRSAQLNGIAFVYPAAAAVLLSPFSLLPQGTADVMFTGVNMVAVPVTLWALRARDWRIYGLSLLWPAAIAGWETANITLLLGLGVALLWRWRERPVAGGLVIGLLVSVKLFLWPLGLWALATRRYRTLGWACAGGLVINLIAWGVVGFGQIGRYRQLLATLTANQAGRGYSLPALAADQGLGRGVGYAAMVCVTTLLVAACLAVGRRAGGRAAFSLCLATCLVCSPIIWLHYFSLLLVPLAVSRPRLSGLWLVPVLLQFPTVEPTAVQIVITYALAAAVTAAATRLRASADLMPDRRRSAGAVARPARA